MLVSRIVTLALVVLSSVMIKFMGSITGAWEFIIECGAGLGLVLILRWYWWRLNAWSEIVAMVVPILAYGVPRLVARVMHPGAPYEPFVRFPESLFFIAGVTTCAWLIITFLTKPVEDEKLAAFYRRVRPGGPGWKRIGPGHQEDGNDSMPRLLVNWLLGMALVYASLFSIGYLVLGAYLKGSLLLAVSAAFFLIMLRRLKKKGAEL